MSSNRYSFRIREYFKNNQTSVLRLLFGLWCVYELVFVISGLKRYFSTVVGYYNWTISDWMINFQGGFVRRGIMGELLYQLYQIHPYPIHIAIIGIVIFAFLILVGLFFYIFKKNGWSFVIFPAAFLFCFSLSNHNLWTRKDYVLLLGAFVVFMLYRRFLLYKVHRWGNYFAMIIIATLLLLIQEASMFFTIPILFCDLFCRFYNEERRGFAMSSIRTVACFLPLIIVYAIIGQYTGDEIIANSIWNSWQPAIERYPLNDTTNVMSPAIEFLSETPSEAMRYNFMINRFADSFLIKIFVPAILFHLYSFMVAYYAVTRLQTVDLKFNKLKSINNVMMSNVIIVQFVFMLPMFTVLSCDTARTVPYWIVSSLLFYHVFQNCGFTVPKWLNKISIKAQQWIDSKPILNNPYFYIVVLITIPMSYCGTPTMFSYRPIKFLYDFLKGLYA